MKYKPHFTDIILLVSLVLLFFGALKISNLERKNKILKKEIEYMDSTINELDQEIDILEEVVQDREIEIKYWGMKYDSIKQLN